MPQRRAGPDVRVAGTGPAGDHGKAPGRGDDIAVGLISEHARSYCHK
jgi:hypothetical protein